MISALEDTIVLRRKATFSRLLAAGSMFSTPLGVHNLVKLGEPVLEHAKLTSKEVAELRRDPEVHAVAQPMPLKLIEPVSAPQTNHAATTGNTWGVEAVHADTSPFTGEGIVVAILDTGINPNHIAFNGVNLVRRNFTQDANGDDIHGHGTHCAGTIFGRNINGLRIGVAPGIKKALIGKVLGEGGDLPPRWQMQSNGLMKMAPTLFQCR
ncbi:MAG: S8 family serine peptidase [Gallionella sp.]|nr:S8 family serine peptidase [Gallionella sp.]MDD4946087.1 S8 family serine peptidase [Gallionella sp.]